MVPLGQVMFLVPNSDQSVRGAITPMGLEQHVTELKENLPGRVP